jgi:peroxiredoxin
LSLTYFNNFNKPGARGVKLTVSKRFAVGIVLVGTLWSGLCLAGSLKVGAPAPLFTLKALNAEVTGVSYVSLGQWVGADASTPAKGALLWFFAPSCAGCREELALLAGLQRTYGSEGLRVLGVSRDAEPEKLEALRTLAKALGVEFPLLSDRYRIVTRRLGVSTPPALYLLDGAGRVVLAKAGVNGAPGRALLSALRRVLGRPTAAPVPEALRPFFPSVSGSLSPAPQASELP